MFDDLDLKIRAKYKREWMFEDIYKALDGMNAQSRWLYAGMEMNDGEIKIIDAMIMNAEFIKQALINIKLQHVVDKGGS